MTGRFAWGKVTAEWGPSRVSLHFFCVVDLKARIAESPVYDDRENALFFTDIPEGRIYRYGLFSGALRHWETEGIAAAIGLCETPGRLVLARRDVVGVYDMASRWFEPLAEVEADNPHTRLNDGKVGPDGAFWVGTIDERRPREPSGALYRVDASGRVERMVEGIRASNGLAWDAAGRVMYHSDSSAGWIDRWSFDPETGAITGRRRFAELDEETGRPDGGTVDAEGCYWSAGVSAGRLNRFGPDGTLREWHKVPAMAPTAPCFAGTDFRTLYVTSLREGRAPEALAKSALSGGLFSAAAPIAGLPAFRFQA